MPNNMKGTDEYVSTYGTEDQKKQYQQAMAAQQAQTTGGVGTHQPTHSPRIEATTEDPRDAGRRQQREVAEQLARQQQAPRGATFDDSSIADAKTKATQGKTPRNPQGYVFDESTLGDAYHETPKTPETLYRPQSGSGSGGGAAAAAADTIESQENIPWADADRVGRVTTDDKESLLEQIRRAQQQQQEQKIDYAVQQGVDQLTRAQEDAASQYQTMRDQIATDEARALDNQVLYAEARGDRGGIGAAQYGAIQNTAATNQLTVNKEQTKLATDTARQIADLRAQGEFQKADELLSLTQSYMSQLMQLKQWADQMNISVDEFNVGVQQWEQEYNMKVRQTLAEAAQQMIAAGATPTEQQLQALGWTQKQYQQYKALLASAKSSGGGGKKDTFLSDLQASIEGGLNKEDLYQAIRQAEISELHDPGMIQQAYALVDRGAQKGDNYFGTIKAP